MKPGLFVASLLLAVAGSALAQSDGKVARVAFVATTSPLTEITGPSPANAYVRIFVESLRDHGYVEGRNLALDMRTLDGNPDLLDGFIVDFVRRKTDVIYVSTTPIVLRALRHSGTTPIVALIGPDLLGTEVVKSEARPGGTVTGPAAEFLETDAKRLELFLQLVPKAKRVAYIGLREDWDRPYALRVRAAARHFGIDLVPLESQYADFATAFGRLRGANFDAVFVERSSRAYGRRQQVGELAAASGVPSCCSHREIAEHGCLFGYGADNLDLARRSASYVARILKGAKPGDLPIEAPVKFELVINMKTARSLGIAIPNTLLQRADRVIE